MKYDVKMSRKSDKVIRQMPSNARGTLKTSLSQASTGRLS